MLDLAIIFFAFLVVYSYLRSFGGKGLSIKGEFAPASTPEGQRQRRLGWALLVMLVGTVAFVFWHDYSSGEGIVTFTPFFLGALVYIAVYLSNRKK